MNRGTNQDSGVCLHRGKVALGTGNGASIAFWGFSELLRRNRRAVIVLAATHLTSTEHVLNPWSDVLGKLSPHTVLA